MLALELVSDAATKEPAGDLARRAVERARESGLLLLTCGLHGNVIRILPPIPIGDEDLDEGLDLLEGALVGAGTDAA